ncbi:uncharacterized protein LOC103316864 [Nasonia vitripennis]|uniref:Uncharacterized protein n=1 Tax=Nasonia vitripennis TaxID=7425 RepID=A0A7M7R1N0_NASVI|nr:uncharacterized protein LOC103316864 [Nasonia vitripennis]
MPPRVVIFRGENKDTARAALDSLALDPPYNARRPTLVAIGAEATTTTTTATTTTTRRTRPASPRAQLTHDIGLFTRDFLRGLKKMSEGGVSFEDILRHVMRHLRMTETKAAFRVKQVLRAGLALRRIEKTAQGRYRLLAPAKPPGLVVRIKSGSDDSCSDAE